MPLIQIALDRMADRRCVARIDVPETGESVSCPFDFSLSPADREDIRWYLEEYKQHWRATSNPVVDRIRRLVERTGAEIFRTTLGAVPAAAIWTRIERRIGETRLEVRDACPEIGTPWELIAEPNQGTRLALHAAEFVRVPASLARPLEVSHSGPVKILLIISRPGGAADVPYWSVARELGRTLQRSVAETVLTVLRPPTFTRLEQVLLDALAAGGPFDVVHFDGHGLLTSPPGGRPKGCLKFEKERGGQQLIDGRLLGELLAEAGVRLLVMNACRSGQSADLARDGTEDGATAFPSLSDQVLAEGVPAVVGMRHAIYAETANRYFATFYERLLAGETVARAGVLGRRSLFEDPFRPFRRDDLTEIEDWSVPFVGEVAPLVVVDPRLTPQRSPEHSVGSAEVPDFVSRDAIVLTIDHLLATGRPVLIHGPIGSGKTRTATELAAWFMQTGGIAEQALVSLSAATTPSEIEGALRRDPLAGPTDGAQPRPPLPRLVIFDQVDVARRDNPAWPELTAALRRALATEREDLRILLTSCSPETSWLPDEVARVPLPPLSMAARRRIAEQWVARRGGQFEFAGWRRVLRFRGGYPRLLIDDLEVCAELQKAGRFDPQQVVRALSDGAWERFPAGGSRGHERLDQDVEHRLTSAADRHIHALVPHIHLFQTTIEAPALHSTYDSVRRADDPPIDVDQVRQSLADLADLGLLNPQDRDQWTKHPALDVASARWASRRPEVLERATKAYTEAIAAIGRECEKSYRVDTLSTVSRLVLHESNLLNSRMIAARGGDWRIAAGTLSGLFTLYRHDGRVLDLRDLLTDAFCEYIDPGGRPRRDREPWAQRFWDWCLWIHHQWGPPFSPVNLVPADGDHYGRAMLLRRLQRPGAVEALQRELERPFLPGRYAAGDIEHLIAEQLATGGDPATVRSAEAMCDRALTSRDANDPLGRTRSLALAAHIHLALADAGSADRRHHLDAASEALIRAENANKYHLAELDAELAHARSIYWLEQGDVEQSTSCFQSFQALLQHLHAYSATAAILFASRLEAKGWIQRALDLAAPAVIELIQQGDHGSATQARLYVQALQERLQRESRR